MIPDINVCLLKNETDLPEDTPLYRYLSTHSFLYLVEFKRLLFTRITNWPDSFEGSRYMFLSKVHQQTEFPGRSKDDFYAMCWSLQIDDPRLFNKAMDHEKAVQELQRNGSAAMWESYCKNGGVRIKTTLGKLNKLLKSQVSDCQLFRGRVYYEPADSLNTTIKMPNIVSTLLHKRVSFRHENEYRYVLVPDSAISKPVIDVKVDSIFDLLDEILACPATSGNEWVSQTLHRVGVDLTITKENNHCINSKESSQFSKISQLYAKVSETIG
jgi:hypothetical protein